MKISKKLLRGSSSEYRVDIVEYLGTQSSTLKKKHVVLCRYWIWNANFHMIRNYNFSLPIETGYFYISLQLLKMIQLLYFSIVTNIVNARYIW